MNWYVLHVATGSENDVHERLNRMVYESLMPAKIVQERHGGSWREVCRVMMPGYLFVRTDMQAADWHRLRRLPGVLRILGDGHPEPLSEREAERIEWLGNGGMPWQLSHGKKTEHGLDVYDGPLAGHEWEILSTDIRQRRARLYAYILGEKLPIDLGLVLDDEREDRQSDDEAG